MTPEVRPSTSLSPSAICGDGIRLLASDAAAEVPFAQMVFLAEGLARHVLVRVLESQSLRSHFLTERGDAGLLAAIRR